MEGGKRSESIIEWKNRSKGIALSVASLASFIVIVITTWRVGIFELYDNFPLCMVNNVQFLFSRLYSNVAYKRDASFVRRIGEPLAATIRRETAISNIDFNDTIDRVRD